MKKQKRLTAAILTISMLLSNVAYAEELIQKQYWIKSILRYHMAQIK